MSMKFNVGSSRQERTNNVTVATTSTAAASAAFGAGIHQIRISAPNQCFYKVDQAPTAAATDALLPAGVIDYVTVSPGQKVSVFSATTQTVSVVEIS